MQRARLTLAPAKSYDCNAIIDYTGHAMASLTIRNLDDSVKAGLRLRAAKHGQSMEEEARQILREAVLPSAVNEGLGSRIHRRFAVLGGVDLSLPERTPSRSPPDLSGTEGA